MTGFDSCSWSCFRLERRKDGVEVLTSHERFGLDAAEYMDECMQARS